MELPRTAGWRALGGRKILLGITGSVAAYRAVDLARNLIRLGAEVRALLTPSALRFVGKALVEWATGSEAIVEETWRAEHVELAEWADALVIAPATLNTLAKIAHGIGDNAVTLTALTVLGSAKRLVVVPTMNERLMKSPQYGLVIDRLRGMGVVVVPPLLEEGKAKFPPIEDLSHCIWASIDRGFDLAGLRALVTAGPTYERIDPVRVITNPSSGLMGVLIARELACRGASVDVVHGPVRHRPPYLAKNFEVKTTAEMARKVGELTLAEQYDLAFFAAAPADYRPAEQHERKVPTREVERMTLELVRTEKVVGRVAKRPRVLAIFAAETPAREEDLVEAGARKLMEIGADIVVANDVSSDVAGFSKDLLKAIIITREGVERVGLVEKPRLSRLLVDMALRFLQR
ncbi:MAG: bifunctional phosphopantothenoylcysteine decarboxylase/phosphopantothenate--cysteine ligase CoaBC [Desulfurococcaceae archaeon]